MTRLRTQSLMIKQFVNLNTRVLPGKPRVAHANPGMIKPSILWTGEWSRKAHDRNKTSHHYRQATVALAFVGCALSAAPPACFAFEQQSMPWRCWNQLVQWQTVVVVAACGILVHDLLVVALVLAVLCLLLLLLFFCAGAVLVLVVVAVVVVAVVVVAVVVCCRCRCRCWAHDSAPLATAVRAHPLWTPSGCKQNICWACWNSSDFELLQSIFPSVIHQFQKRTPCIGVCANLLEVVDVAIPCYDGNRKRWENPCFQQTQHLKGGNSPRCWVIFASEPPL